MAHKRSSGAKLATIQKLPRPPAHLNKIGKAHWNQQGASLIENGMLASIDLGALEAASYLYSQMRGYMQGDIVMTINQYLRISQAYMQTMKEFCATPTARSRAGMQLQSHEAIGINEDLDLDS